MLRNTDISTFLEKVQSDAKLKADFIVPAKQLVDWPQWDINHVSESAHGQIATKLDIPKKFYDKLRTEPDLQSSLYPDTLDALLARDSRSFLIRQMSRENGEYDTRAFLSDSYGRLDNLECCAAVLAGIEAAGADIKIESCDLTDQKMYMRIRSASIAHADPEFLAHYAPAGLVDDPEGGIYSGFEVSNSETGFGRLKIVPRMIVRVCANGMVGERDVFAKTHLGARLTDQGHVNWSEGTQSKNQELIQSMAKDAVSTFLDKAYCRTMVDEWKVFKDVRAEVKEIEALGNSLEVSEGEIGLIVNRWIEDGDHSVLGVGQAFTRVAQKALTGDRQADLERLAPKAMKVLAG